MNFFTGGVFQIKSPQDDYKERNNIKGYYLGGRRTML